jgi:putative transposase
VPLTGAERRTAYRELIEYVRQVKNKGTVLGSDRFIEEVEALTGKRLKEGKRGRPVGWRKVNKDT